MSCRVKLRPVYLLVWPGTISYERGWPSLFLPVALTTRHQRSGPASPASSLVTGVRVVRMVGVRPPGLVVSAESNCSTLLADEPSRPKFSRQKTLWLWLVA